VEVTAAQVAALRSREHEPSGPGSAKLARCSAKATAATAGSVTVRRPASVLGGPGDEAAMDLGHLLGDRDPAMQQVNPLDPQPDQLAPAQPTEGGHTSGSSTTTWSRASPTSAPWCSPQPLGALFQRPAQRVPTPRLQEIESLTG
jgi:hypothetical protein